MTNRLDATVKEIQAAGGKALSVTVDVTNRAEVESLVQKAIDTYGKIDVLVSNAGIMPIAPLALLKVDEWVFSPKFGKRDATCRVIRRTQDRRAGRQGAIIVSDIRAIPVKGVQPCALTSCPESPFPTT